MTIISRMQQKRGTAAQWIESDPVLADGEFGVETDTTRVKIGDGVNTWTELSYFADPIETVPPTTSMWFDYERGDNGEATWDWTVPVGLDQTRAIVPILHSSHIGPHPLDFNDGGLDGNTPANLTTGYVGDEFVSDAGLYHVEGLIVGSSGGSSSAAVGNVLKIFWNIGLFPVGVEEPPIDLLNWGIEKYVTLNGDVWTSHISGDTILDGDRNGANIASPWMRLGDPGNPSATTAARAAVNIMKVIITARRLSSWPLEPSV